MVVTTAGARERSAIMSAHREAPATSRTAEMKVANIGFMLDRMGQDCSPLQFLRELTENATQAIQATPEGRGEIVWDVDWNTHILSDGLYKLCCIDTGVGMTGDEMYRYINML